MSILININDISAFKSISANIDVSKALEPYIHAAQDLDLRPFMGEQMYIDFIDDFEGSPSLQNPAYQKLFNGCTYTYANRKYRHEGLKTVLVYFTYARYIAKANSVVSRYGIVNKKNDWSEPASESTINRISKDAKSEAIVYQQRVKLFLDFNRPDYPLWRFGIHRRRTQMRITPVGGNSSIRDKFQMYNRNMCGSCGYFMQDCMCGGGFEPEITIS